jgi:hypothetical protein
MPSNGFKGGFQQRVHNLKRPSRTLTTLSFIINSKAQTVEEPTEPVAPQGTAYFVGKSVSICLRYKNHDRSRRPPCSGKLEPTVDSYIL